VLASLLAAMPLGVVRPDALPKHRRVRILAPPAPPSAWGGADWPLLSDVEIANFLDLPEGPLPDELRLKLDRIEEGSLTLFRRLASVAQGIRSVVELTVKSAKSIPGPGPALHPLARMGDAVRGT
jgi:hypothetical protein